MYSLWILLVVVAVSAFAFAVFLGYLALPISGSSDNVSQSLKAMMGIGSLILLVLSVVASIAAINWKP